MNHFIKITLSLVLMIFFAGCSQQAKEDKLLNVYKQILIVRASEPDSVAANTKVRNILQQNGYTLESFKKEFMDVAKDNKEFFARLDSLRNSLNREYNQKVDSIRKYQSSPTQ
ncbi:MAG TPA: hypothetical protein PLC04_01775 [Candidatus Kapabacteria bacterium]|nr:hypothetical protein [Candidatus Kapabacteria bacterium]HOV91794.1 hypothetical protein [Candidatus Kapabacteria bacterium]